MAAPAAAPSKVPIAPPVTVLSVEARPLVVPVCCSAHCRHDASSIWNWSKFFPVPGSTITLGPAGMLAQPVTSTPATTQTAADRIRIG
jgi:hypothetical protein